MSLLYIFAAAPMEGQPVRKIGVVSATSSSLRCGPNELTLMISGMGPTSARQKAEPALKVISTADNGRKPDALLVVGLCGGISPSLPERAIVAYTECLSTEPTKDPA